MSEPIAPGSNRPTRSDDRPASASYSRDSAGAPRKSPVLSIISLISGIVGFLLAYFAFGFLFSIAAIVLGHLGQRKESAAKRLWLWGLITGYLGLVANIAALVVGLLLVGAALEQIPAT